MSGCTVLANSQITHVSNEKKRKTLPVVCSNTAVLAAHRESGLALLLNYMHSFHSTVPFIAVMELEQNCAKQLGP